MVRDETAKDHDFLKKHQNDLCASFQKSLIHVLMDKLIHASENTGIKEIAIAGGVSANSGLREALKNTAAKRGWNIFIPKMEYCTDNASHDCHYRLLQIPE